MSKQYNYVVTATIHDDGAITFALDLDRTDTYFEDAYIYEDPDMLEFPEQEPQIRPLQPDEIPVFEALGDRIHYALSTFHVGARL